MKEELFAGRQIRTASGIYIDVFDPKEEEITIEDIAHALSNQCRFSGHLPRFYSVAQHSVLCSKLAEGTNKLAALLHDASEAYLLDIPSPIKPHLSNYKKIEDNLMKFISKKFGFTFPLNKHVKAVDRRMLEIEWHHIMLDRKHVPDDEDVLECWTPEEAKEKFLEAFNELKNN